MFEEKDVVYFDRNEHVICENHLQLCNSERFVFSDSDRLCARRMMMNSAGRHRKARQGRYDMCSMLNASVEKPSLDNFCPYGFSANPDTRDGLKAVQSGSRYEWMSNGDAVNAIFATLARMRSGNLSTQA